MIFIMIILKMKVRNFDYFIIIIFSLQLIFVFSVCYLETYGTFDFIIIGAGSAGTMLANRLSQWTAWKILVLEGGGDDTQYTDIPAMAGLLQFTKHSWAFRSTRQKGCCLGKIIYLLLNVVLYL